MICRLWKLATCIVLMVVWGDAYAIDIDQIGSAVIKDLHVRYEHKVEGCSADNSRPALECSGIIFRVTRHGNYNPWDPSPTSDKTGGISFSYWRSDVMSVIYPQSYNGYLLDLPERSLVNKKLVLHALCFFPINGTTNGRDGEGGLWGVQWS